jgi:hypothetical protein
MLPPADITYPPAATFILVRATAPGPAPRPPARWVNYANYPTGSSGHPVYVFEQSVPLQSGKTVAAVTLPALGDLAGHSPALHIFAISAG